jgi:hypothetical protein
MLIELTQIFVRPNTETPWFHDTWSAGHMEYIQTTYKDTGKYAGSRELSDDELMLTVVHIFTDENAQFEFITDEYLIDMLCKRDAHNASNNINRLI